MTFPDSVDDKLNVEGLNLVSNQDYVIEATTGRMINLKGDVRINGLNVLTDDTVDEAVDDAIEAALALYVTETELDTALPWINVKDRGAVGNGVTDDSAVFAAVAAELFGLGGGTLFIPKGDFVVVNVPIYDNVRYIGAGRYISRLVLKPASSGQVFLSDGWATYYGGTSSNGPKRWEIRDLTIDCNGANNPGGCWGMLVYGYDYVIDNIEILNARTGAINSSWGTATGPMQMSCTISNAKLNSAYSANGVVFDGPHDSHFENVEVIGHTNPPPANQRAFYFGAKSGGTRLSRCHAWGYSEWVAEIDAGTLIWFEQCYLEGGQAGQLWVKQGAVQYRGGLIFGNNTVGAKGIKLGHTGGLVASGCDIHTEIWYCNGGAIEYVDQVNNKIRVMVARTGTDPIEVGTANNTDWSDYDIQVHGNVSSSERKSLRRRLVVTNRADAASPVITSKGCWPAQTAPMQSWQDAFGTELASVEASGSFKTAGTWNGPHIILGSNHIWTDATGALRIKASAPASDLDGRIVGSQIPIISYSGAAVTAALTDAGSYLRFTNAAPVFTIPLNATVAFPVGTKIDGVGTIAAMTIAATGGVTINKARTLVTVGADSGWTIIKVGTNEWDLHGDFV